MSLTTFFGLMGRWRAVVAAFVPFVDKVPEQVNVFLAAIGLAARSSARFLPIRAPQLRPSIAVARRA